jgi:hypothetical protein
MKYFGYGNGLVDSTGIEIACFNNIHTASVCEGKNLSTCDHVTESHAVNKLHYREAH